MVLTGTAGILVQTKILHRTIDGSRWYFRPLQFSEGTVVALLFQDQEMKPRIRSSCIILFIRQTMYVSMSLHCHNTRACSWCLRCETAYSIKFCWLVGRLLTQISATYIDPNLVGYNVIALDDKAVKFYAGSFRSVSHSNYMLV